VSLPPLVSERARALRPRALVGGDPRRALLGFDALAGAEASEHLALIGTQAPARDLPASGLVAWSVPRDLLRLRAEAHPDLELLALCDAMASMPAPRPRIVGVLNATPDSFSDGGASLDELLARGLAMVAAGADWLDIGGESTRPGAEPVAPKDEIARVVPLIQALARRVDATLSIDTRHADTAFAALRAGASVVNDVTAGLCDPDMLDVVAQADAGYIAMHMQGEPRTMQAAPHYDEVVGEVLEFLRARAAAACEAGIDPARLWIDPGIGFGKTLEHNLVLLARLGELRSLGLPVMLGASRKSFIAKLDDRASDPADRLGGSLAAAVHGVQGGVDLVRVHDAAATRQAIAVAHAIVRRREAGRG
jgi:dihydropteroate synthase